MTVVGDSPFLKRVLIPFWVIRIIIMIVAIGLYSLTLGVISSTRSNLQQLYREYGISSNEVDGIIARAAVIVVMIVLCLILDIVCIVQRARRTLSPKFFLIVNVLQSTLWIVLCVISLTAARSKTGIIVDVIVLLSFIGLLIYASVIFHQHRMGTLRGKYQRAGGNDMYGHVESHGLVATTTGYPSQIPHPNAGQNDYNKQYYDNQSYGAPAAAGQTQPYNPPAYPAHTESHFQQRYN